MFSPAQYRFECRCRLLRAAVIPVWLGWIAAAAFLGIACVLYIQNSVLRGQLADAQDEFQNQRQASAPELDQLRKQEAELDRLRRETEEIHRLRNEVRQLRNSHGDASSARPSPAPEDLQRLEMENRALRAQLEKHQNTQDKLSDFQAAAQAAVEANGCRNNLNLIAQAVAQWVEDFDKAPGSHIAVSEIALYFEEGTLPTCPSSGQYRLTTVGEPPTCSFPEH